jgi:2-polyprenyl-6-methoxyphenol hydroxylase-like FAD-dependent oxidoreductase
MAPRIRVAICGGGIAGSCLFHSLLQHQHLDVHIFESASNFKDVGGALGITRNAITALELIGPSAKESLDRAGAVPMGGVRFMLAAGENQGALIDEANAEVQSNRISSIVHRGTLVREFLRDLPQERMHASKKLERVASSLCEDGSTERLTLQFDDGTTHECDVLIGADGIRSLVRKTILGEEDPATYPRNTGTWAIMTLKPYDEAQAAFGPELINKSDTREYMWVGDGSFFLHNVLDSGDTAQIILSSNDASVEQKDAWKRKVGVEEMKDLCKDWPRELNKAVHEVSRLCNLVALSSRRLISPRVATLRPRAVGDISLGAPTGAHLRPRLHVHHGRRSALHHILAGSWRRHVRRGQLDAVVLAGPCSDSRRGHGRIRRIQPRPAASDTAHRGVEPRDGGDYERQRGAHGARPGAAE